MSRLSPRHGCLRADRLWRTYKMNPQRLVLYVLTALAGVGAIYFWAIHVAAAAMGALIVLIALVIAAIAFRAGRKS